MAKRAVTVARTAKKTVSTTTSRRIDTKYLRPEVLSFKGLDEKQIHSAIRDTLNFNNYMYTVKDGHEWLDKFAKSYLTPADYKLYALAEDWQATMTYCTLAKMVNAGCELPEKSVIFLKKRIDELVKIGHSKSKEASSKPSQTKSINSVAIVCGEIDAALDKWPEPIDLKGCIGSIVMSKADIEYARDFYSKQLAFVKEALKDKELKTGYRFLKTEGDRKAYIARLEAVVNGLVESPVVRKAPTVRKPRTVKAKSADQLVKKVNFQTESREYNITSLHPRSLIGANMVLLFNTCTRHLTLLKSKEGFGVSGTSLVNVDKADSFVKILRKPTEVLPNFAKVTKARVVVAFDAIKTTPQAGSGRLNANTIILKVY